MSNDNMAAKWLLCLMGIVKKTKFLNTPKRRALLTQSADIKFTSDVKPTITQHTFLTKYKKDPFHQRINKMLGRKSLNGRSPSTQICWYSDCEHSCWAGTNSFQHCRCRNWQWHRTSSNLPLQARNVFFYKTGNKTNREETICIKNVKKRWMQLLVARILHQHCLAKGRRSSHNAWEKSRHINHVDIFYDSGAITEEIDQT